MLTHLMLFKFKEAISESDRKALIDRMIALRDEIPQIQRSFGGHDCIQFTKTNIEFNKGYTHAVCFEFETPGLFASYLQHPAQHQINNVLNNTLDDILLFTVNN